jgi:hypothetical protein
MEYTMRQLDTPTLIRATEIQSILNCSRQYAYTVLNQLPRINLCFTATRPPRACLRSDFNTWLADNNIVVGGAL